VIVVEDLHVAGLLRNRPVARAIADQGWAEFHRQLRAVGELVAASSAETQNACGGEALAGPLRAR
jgi:transposase